VVKKGILYQKKWKPFSKKKSDSKNKSKNNSFFYKIKQGVSNGKIQIMERFHYFLRNEQIFVRLESKSLSILASALRFL
jgi:hypothetical protein